MDLTKLSNKELGLLLIQNREDGHMGRKDIKEALALAKKIRKELERRLMIKVGG